MLAGHKAKCLIDLCAVSVSAVITYVTSSVEHADIAVVKVVIKTGSLAAKHASQEISRVGVLHQESITTSTHKCLLTVLQNIY